MYTTWKMLWYVIIVLFYLSGITLPQSSCVNVLVCDTGKHPSHHRRIIPRVVLEVHIAYEKPQLSGLLPLQVKTADSYTNGRKWLCSTFHPLLWSGVLWLELDLWHQQFLSHKKHVWGRALPNLSSHPNDQGEKFHHLSP